MLFDDNLGFMAYNLYPNMMNNKNTTNSNDLVSVDEGFFRGNMFKNEYKPYKNYTYKKIVPKTKKEELLLEIMELSFVINDLNLYLDLIECGLSAEINVYDRLATCYSHIGEFEKALEQFELSEKYFGKL